MQLIQQDSYGHILRETVISAACAFVVEPAYLGKAVDGGLFFSQLGSFFRGFTYDSRSQVRIEVAVIVAADGGYMISDFRPPRYSDLQLQDGFNYESPIDALDFALTILEDREQTLVQLRHPFAPPFLIYVSQHSLDAEIDAFISSRLDDCKLPSGHPAIFNIRIQDRALFAWRDGIWARVRVQHGETQSMLSWLGAYMVSSSARAPRAVKPDM